MSGLLAGKVWHSGLPSLFKPLAACLADEGNDQGEGIYPSIAYLAWKLGTSERSVQRGMRGLREIGVICEMSKKKFGRIFLPVYSMDVSKLPYRKPWAEARRGDTGDVASATGDTDGVTSNGDGVTPVTRRGDTAVSPNPLVDPLERPVSKEGAAQPTAIPATEPLPHWIPLEPWRGYIEMRKKIRRPLTDHAVFLAIRELAKLRAEGHDPQAVLEHSIFNSYQGLFAPTGVNGKGGSGATKRTRHNLEAAGFAQ
ncbi:MAG: hypothetical protein WA876_11275 [Candidatus Acidiferrales bacterium]